MIQDLRTPLSLNGPNREKKKKRTGDLVGFYQVNYTMGGARK